MIRSTILESGRLGMNPESNLISCTISENVPNFSRPHFLVSKVEPRQLPTKVTIRVELNEKRHAQFFSTAPAPTGGRQWFPAVPNTDAKTPDGLHVSCYSTGTRGMHRGFPSQGTPV